MESILKRVLYKPILIPDFILAKALMDIVSKKLNFQVQNFLVFREDNVPTLVISEPVFLKATAQPATLRFLFQDLILMSQEVS